jgi:hypothetical protein
VVRETIGTDWLVRTIEPMPNGAIVLRRDDLKQAFVVVGSVDVDVTMLSTHAADCHDCSALMGCMYLPKIPLALDALLHTT